MILSVARPRAWQTVLLAAAITVLLMLVALVEPSMAASKVGRNVGKEIQTWAAAILLGIAGLVAVPILAKRDVGGGLVLALLVVVVGGFVFAPNAVKDVIDGIWKAVSG